MKVKLNVSLASGVRSGPCPECTEWNCGIAYRTP